MKIGLYGVGHLGNIHLKCLKETDWEVIGVYDPNKSAVEKVLQNYNIKAFDDPQSLLEAVDAVDIVSTTTSHFELVKKAIIAGKHVFVEKPLADSLSHAEEIVHLAETNSVKVQVGHVERYNPAILAIRNRNIKPKFIEGHRLTTYNTRGNDVSVVHDLMIHDIDLILSMIDSPVSNVQANGVCVVNDTPDICNARISFENGAVANLTASRISMKNMRKIRFFQENEYLSLDLISKECQIISLSPADEKTEGMTILSSSGKKLINVEIPEVAKNNAIVDELSDFYRAVKNNTPTLIDAKAGYKAMELVQKIDQSINL